MVIPTFKISNTSEYLFWRHHILFCVFYLPSKYTFNTTAYGYDKMYYTQNNVDFYIAEKDQSWLNFFWDEGHLIPLLQGAPKIEPTWQKLISLLSIYVFIKISSLNSEDFIERFDINQKHLNRIVLNTIIQKLS